MPDDELLKELQHVTDAITRQHRYLMSRKFGRKIMWSVGWGVIASVMLSVLIILLFILVFGSAGHILQWIQHPPSLTPSPLPLLPPR